MKVGILTFHSQLNYGGVLQCWALKKVLEDMGQEVVVVDRWLDEKNAALRREFAWLGWKGWMKLVVRGLLGCGNFGKLLRTIRTIRFVRGLGLSKEHFLHWKAENSPQRGRSPRPTIAGEDLDLLVVGSDQVWHCGNWGDPRPYLLEGAPEIRAIAYAASFGLKSIPADMIDLYKRGFGRFSAISCREKEGVEICRGLGYEAVHVVDPTLLVDPSEWFRLIKSNNHTIKQSNDRKLVCYFMGVDVVATLPILEDFAAKMDCTVEVLTNDQLMLKSVPKSFRQVIGNFSCGRVKICRGYGPREFVKAFALATWVLTDSFHAMMFSAIFGADLRFLKPRSAFRAMMFARVEEFATRCIRGVVFADRVEIALLSFERGEKAAYDFKQIAAMRAESMSWLKNALK